MATRFRFRLEVIRRLREQAQDAQRRVVADAARAVSRIDGRIARMRQELEDTARRSRDIQQTRQLDLTSLRGDQFYRGWLHHRIIESGEERRHRQAELDRERAKLVEVSKRLKVIERLREKQWRCHQAAAGREEQGGYDEIALQAYIRRDRESKREARELC